MSQQIILIAALSKNHVIGVDNRLPWELPADWENFKRVTNSHAFIMGRKSFESEDMLYSDHRNVVLSRQSDLKLPKGFVSAGNLKEALEVLSDEDRVFILGGESVFTESLSLATHLFLTQIEAVVDGDTKFPNVNWENWKLIKQQYQPIDHRHQYAFYINEYERKA